MDISQNKTGSLPVRFFKNFKAMTSADKIESRLDYIGNNPYYQDNMMVTMKGRNMELVKILATFTSINFSKDNFKTLNGFNELTRKILEKLLDLTSLEVLDLLYNKLVGQILKGRQFKTFPNDSYVGNLGLCKFPLSKNYNKNKTKEPSTFARN
ncbi:hypothetical protein QQP08_021559 [Theobroma cacao]|nr:hypothetical protein QQP08_021559 [Theobroma cacao]